MAMDAAQLQTQLQQQDLDIAALQRQMTEYQQKIQELVAEIEAAEKDGHVSIDKMMQLQMQMSLMSQYVEAVSSALQAMHQAMMSMARAIKGQ
ncbi:MAG TPA: DUF5407 family protein [Alphaproteobacteria bacterium]|nr:DUF5407 family protein [Alphaproteobacteria bacterium]